MIPTDACRKFDRTDTVTPGCLLGRGTDMDMDKTASSFDTTDIPGAVTQRLASVSSFHTVAPPNTTRCSVVGIGQSSHIPNPAAKGTEVTRLRRLYEAVRSGSCISRIKGKRVWETTVP